ncbi:hypothetical protein PDESU_04638 [Pontiella desulfatans]|uniref:Uncharacterized protein n=1 Tax=Pontiella desulfatans TaxID=2750659 RepID=A0A6C2U7I5_PONDE|nr:hypothetical protein [Pontiella desulfatans]VGO16048.1 hypothetical protein PDESU_04638 [Pontiella desulfatans]
MKRYSTVKRMAGSMRSYATRSLVVLGVLALLNTALAQQQFQGVCSRVKIEILQELSLERIGFLATLEVTNNDGVDSITDFSAQLTFTDPSDPDGDVENNASDWFFVRAPEMENINNITGQGIIAPTQKAVVRWFIVPKPGAGGEDPAGKRYRVGCSLSAKFQGEYFPDDVLFAVPDMITVQPQPLLDIAYFQPRDVQGDDPFTETVEAPIPFILGVLVRNVGYGQAKNVMIRSEQPRIVENEQSLLLVPRLLGVRVMDSPLDRTSLTVNIGNLAPGTARKAAWDMITTLSGEFVEFKATYTHAPEFGGEETSLITNLVAHFIAKEVLNDAAGRDDVLDFLADTDRDDNMIPDALYESEGQILPVNHIVNAALGSPPGPGQALVEVDSDRTDWCYMRLDDPRQAKLPIDSVVRGDGKVVNTNNYWTNVRYRKTDNARLAYLNIFDLCNLGSNTYTVTYGAVPADTNPPVTTIEFAGEMVNSGTNYYITDETQMFFLSTDDSPVSIEYSITNAPFQPAYPFWIREAGEYNVRFFATDSANNVEDTNEVRLIVNGAPADVQQFDKDEESVLLTGDALSIRPGSTRISFAASDSPLVTDAQVDVFRGIIAWTTVSNVPCSPNALDSATLYVGGEYVDYYKYRLDGGGWSSQRMVAEPISLSGLGDGVHTVDVLGRPRYGSYPPESEAVGVSWEVDSSANPVQVFGAPATPTRLDHATLMAGGTGVTDYRWRIDEDYFHAIEPVATPFSVEKLVPGLHAVDVRGQIGGVLEETNVFHSVSWLVDPLLGHGYDAADLVRSVTFSNVGSSVTDWIWDGKNGSGSDVLPGWYTVRLTLVNELSQTNFATMLVQVEDLYAEGEVLAAADRGPATPYARGRWMVWQDQSDGSPEIFARDLLATNGVPRQLTVGDFTQKNPKTDGHYAVWQGRRSDSSWDLYMADLDNTGAVVQVTSSLGRDEINPDIEWPWIVFQSKSTSSPDDPWQLHAINLAEGGTNVVLLPGIEDQLYPDIDDGRVVWADWRDSGPGEIYYMDLERGDWFRVTDNIYGQYNPVLMNQWIVWQDNRHSQVELYGYDLLRQAEIRLTDTAENEAFPFLDGGWVCCQEDSLGVGQVNLRLIHLSNLAAIPLTRSEGAKRFHSVNGRKLTWLEGGAVQSAELPAIQAVFRNMNAVPVTQSVADQAADAYTLLERWNSAVGVTEISRFTSIVPTLVQETAMWSSGATGDNFALVEGDFLWIRFGDAYVADMGAATQASVDLQVGVNVVSLTDFPQPCTAHRLMRGLGLGNVRALRMLDPASGRWFAAEVRQGKLLGYDFAIPASAVLLVDMQQAVNDWRPE